MERISSRDNQHLVIARKVRDGKDKSRIFIEGKRLADEAIQSGIDIVSCFVSDMLTDSGASSMSDDVNTYVLPEKLFRSIADTENSQGIILIAPRPELTSDEISRRFRSAEIPVVVFLNQINNPANLGAVLRTAEAAGAAGVIVSDGSADAFSPKALRASMGSAFRLPVLENVDIGQAVEIAHDLGLIMTAADNGAETDHTGLDWRIPRMLVLGSEAHGLSEDALRLAEERVLIRMSETVESLNLAVSAGVLLFEARRQNAVSD